MRELVVAHRQVTDEQGQARVFHYAVQIGEMELSGGFAFYVSGTFPGLQLQFWAIKE